MGVDLSPAMLEYARQHNSQGSIAYELLDITSPTEVAAFISKNGQFQRVYCFLCFHFVPDQTVAFLNIGNLLAAYGECLVTACITNPFVDAWQTLHTMPEWKSWVTDPRDVLPSWYYFNYSGTSAQIEDETRKCVVDAGLECMACEVTECTWLLRDVAYVFEFYSDVFPVSVDLPSRDKNALKEAFIEQLRPLVKETPRGCEMVVRIYRVHARPR
ncbi:hypothetical protein HPB50_004278 [Hyalomma asiaticum]|uniref:Uncharacterized protein n=1 Tax=Hyalomma asiaticum TaxID=266040 RepID=A0ACB7TAT6_HYAAI|nr:hypothetical protein HPB50_004278 [Hyalomma asiaticum]